MKDFTNPLQILQFLIDKNASLKNALATDDIITFNSIIDELRQAELYKSEQGQNIISFYNLFVQSGPFDNIISNFIFDTIKDNDLLLTDDNFRKMVYKIQDDIETSCCYLATLKNFLTDREAIRKAHEDSNYDEFEIKKRNKDAVNPEENKNLKKYASEEKKLQSTLIDAQLSYFEAIKKTFTTKQPEFPVSEDGLLDTYTYEDLAMQTIQPIIGLANMRKKYRIEYTFSLDYVIDIDSTETLPDALRQIEEFRDTLHDSDYDTIAFKFLKKTSKKDLQDTDSYIPALTLSEYIMKSMGFSGNDIFSTWSKGRHYKNEYKNNQREWALRTFLFLAIPATYMDEFFKKFGICFGTSTDTFISKDDEHIVLPESYIKELIYIGVGYDVINYIVPMQRTQRNMNKSK